MSLELKCKVEDMTPSYIPNIYILELQCDKGTIKMDIHKAVNIVRKGDNVLITISRSIPQYEEGKDFLARGYVITKREIENRYKVLISLWGFLVVIESTERDIYEEFDYMDEIFFLMKRL